MSTTVHTQKPRLGATKAGWLPQQHGAWAMLFLPYMVGVVLRWQNGPVPAYLWPLLPTWILGFFAFNALSLWLKWRKPVYLRPLYTYGAATAFFGLITLALAPLIVSWALFFAPLLGIGLWRAALRDDASILARGSAVVAACLMCAVVAVGSPGHWLHLPLSSRAWICTLALWGYFLGTLFYVKTMIRERGEPGYYWLSVIFHVLVLLLFVWAWQFGKVAAALPIFFTLTTVRAANMPYVDRWRLHWWSIRSGQRATFKHVGPKQVGLLEFAFSLLLLGVLGWGNR